MTLDEEYKKEFSDIFGDADDDLHQEAIIEAFLKALDEWLEHHVSQAQRYKLMRESVRKALGMS